MPVPVLSVPVLAWPDPIPHTSVVEMVREYYDRADVPGDDRWRRDVAKGLALGESLGADVKEHPLALAPDLIVKERGFGSRNAEARVAFGEWGGDAARAALASTGVPASGIDAILVANSTCVAMPDLAYDLIEALHLQPDVDVLHGGMAGCLGGAYAIAAAATYVRAHPHRRVLIVTADFASSHLHRETQLTGADLIGAVLSACLFSDGAAAAVMSCEPDVEGFAIHGTRMHTLPGRKDAAAWEVTEHGLQFRSAPAPALVQQFGPSLLHALAEQGWTPDDLDLCALHTGGPRVIDAVRDAAGLSEPQIAPTRAAMRIGDTMSVAVMHALNLIATQQRFRPPAGARGLGAGIGPGFSAISFTWTHHP